MNAEDNIFILEILCHKNGGRCVFNNLVNNFTTILNDFAIQLVVVGSIKTSKLIKLKFHNNAHCIYLVDITVLM